MVNFPLAGFSKPPPTIDWLPPTIDNQLPQLDNRAPNHQNGFWSSTRIKSLYHWIVKESILLRLLAFCSPYIASSPIYQAPRAFHPYEVPPMLFQKMSMSLFQHKFDIIIGLADLFLDVAIPN